MTVLALLTIALFAGAVFAAPQSSRIVGGTETSIEKFPSIVAVESYSVFFASWFQSCGANILTTRYVLSAAHCFSGILYNPSYRRIRAGSSYRITGGIVAYVEVEFNHPSYGLNGYDGDISVIRLSTPLVYSPVVQQATIVVPRIRDP